MTHARRNMRIRRVAGSPTWSVMAGEELFGAGRRGGEKVLKDGSGGRGRNCSGGTDGRCSDLEA